MRHRRLFVMIKVVLLAGIMTFTFSTRSDTGKVVHHGASSTYAGGSGTCGDAVCKSTDAGCTVSNTDCAKISTGACGTIAGCVVATEKIYSCTGTMFSCVGATSLGKSTCTSLGCIRLPNNTCGNDNGLVKETCSSLSQSQCQSAGGAIGDCSSILFSTNETCGGTIYKPTKESDCGTLSGLLISFGITATRTPAYIEDANSCPTDCASNSVCGNGIIEGSEICDNGGNNSDTTPGACKTNCEGYYIPSAVCGNGIKETGEFCDNGTENSDTTPGACTTACKGLVAVVCSGTVVVNSGTCNTIALPDPAKECGNYYYALGSQCTYDSKTSLCTESNSCTIPVVAVCGNGKIEKPEICDNGGSNSDTIPGACKTTCYGLVATGAVCGNGTKEAGEACDNSNNNGNVGYCSIDCKTTATITTYGNCNGYSTTVCSKGNYMGPNGGCSAVYSKTSNAQCALDTKTLTCVPDTNAVCIQEDVCGNDKIEGNEACDDGNTTDGDGCSSTCTLQDKNVSYTAGGSIVVTYGDGVTYNGSKKWFFVPAGIDIFMFTDSGISLGHDGKSFLFGISYTATGDIDNLSNSGSLGWASNYSLFLIPYSGTITYPITGFTFTDSGVNMQATWSGDVWNFSLVNAVCGNGKVEGSEMCDNGANNGKAGMCNSTCTGTTVAEKKCGNSIVEAGETCDDGIHNGKPGQCTNSCDARKSYNGFCGDTTCRSSCSLDESLTCNDLTTLSGGMDMCSTLGCYIQNIQEYSCKGAVSCSEITPEKFWGTIYGAQKYCNIAGCAWNDKTSLCGTPKTGKNPSCTPLNQEYCGREPGCTLVNQTAKNICMGNTLLRTDKLSQAGCTLLNGQWNTEDTNSCNIDCQSTCASQEAPSTCSELSVGNCTNYFNAASMINCVVVNDKIKGMICTDDKNKCTSCGNNVCDGKETEKTCAKDCVTQTPTISYTPKRPIDGSLIAGPVTIKLVLPGGKDCKILNNNNSPFYTIKYNGYYVYQVVCPWFEKPWDMVAKVDWIQSDTIMAINAKEISKFNSGGSLLYCENTLVDNLSTNTNIVDFTKTNIYTQGVISGNKDSISQSPYTQEVKTDKNISFEGDSKVYQKLLFEKEIDANATKQVSLSVPSEVNLSVKDEGKTSDFNGVFLAPTQVTGSLLATVTNDIENIDVIIKAGDSTNQELSAKDQTGNTIPFTMTIWTRDELGSLLDVYSSQEGNTWAFYTGVLVEPCTDKTHVNGYNCATFEVPHLTYYGITTNLTGNENNTGGTVEQQPSGGSNGGGGGSSINQCTADRDCKNSYLNQLCGACTEYEKSETIKAKEITITCNKYTAELNGAFSFAFANAITTISNCEKANLQGTLLRSHMAKMMSNFAINTLGLKPNTGTACAFTDMNNESSEMKFYATLACQLGLMGLDTDGTVNSTFSPNELVTRAQFGTVLSRLLRGDKNNGGTVYYEQHLQALKNANIMKKISAPGQQELRGRVMLMLQRITDQVAPSANSNQTLRESIQQLFGIK